MKIAMAWAYRDLETWSTPIGVYRELLGRGIEVDAFSLFEEPYSRGEGYSHTGTDALLRAFESGYRPDVVLFMDYGQFHRPEFGKHACPSAVWVQEAGDDPQQISGNLRNAPKFDLVLTPDKPSLARYRLLGVEALWWTHHADDRLYRKKDGARTTWPAVSSCGVRHPDLAYLGQMMPGDFLNVRVGQGEKHADLLRSGRIVVQRSQYGEVTRRPFEAAACGSMVLSDRLAPERALQELYDEGREIVLYDGPIDLLEKVRWYSRHDAEREAIAHAGHRRTVACHTQRQRVTALLKAIEG